VRRASKRTIKGPAMKAKNNYLTAVFITPTTVILVVLAFVPTIYAINISLQDRELSGADVNYVWLKNFIQLFSDRRFLNAALVSLKWELVTVSATMIIAIFLAILMFEALSPRSRNALSLLFLMPVLFPRVSAAYVWKFAFHPLFGLATYPYKVFTESRSICFPIPLRRWRRSRWSTPGNGRCFFRHHPETARNAAAATL
jgi:multiple sugar transport system permease protein